MVRDSDNDVAEILARLVGLKINGDGSFTGGSRAITSVLATKGIDTSRLKVADGSGLSTKNKVTVGVVAAVLTEMVRGDQAQWASIATGLPIAAETGTLENRFNSKGTRAGAGVVLAKTGSLTGVSSLAGTVKDRSGRLLVFVLMSNKITSIPSARNTMDRIAATLAKCGCTE
jgi:D-alanyl-D-alanine carboxypeptidase/D-alanyl-D-alanine-endopeptidase (penicillin-binding protein 4)